jgi:hypothetical protein
MLATDIAAAVDEVVFARRLGLTADPWQADALRSGHPRQLYNTARQSGKSTIAALKALHRAQYHPGSLILLLSPSLRQSGELFKKVAGFAHQLGEEAPAEAESAMRMELKNGSRIVSLPGTEGTVRGYSSVDLLIFDEAARVSDDLYMTTRPMLAVSRGSLIALSTPYGTRGWWWGAWHSKDDWERYRVTAEEVPRISPEFLEEEQRSMGDWFFRQEYECDFQDAITAAFATEHIEALFEEVEQWEL